MPEGQRRTASVVGFLIWCLLAFGCSLLLFVLACCLPAAQLQNDKPIFGFPLLLFGWYGIFNAEFGWYANVLLLFSWVFLMTGLLSRYFWIAAILTGIGAVLVGATQSVGCTFYINEAGGHSQIVRLLIGSRVWLASMAVPAAAAFVVLVVSMLLPKTLPADLAGRLSGPVVKQAD
jgi:hypothetical protein